MTFACAGGMWAVARTKKALVPRSPSAQARIGKARRGDAAVVPGRLAERAWHAVWLVVDTEAREVSAGWAPIAPRLGEDDADRLLGTQCFLNNVHGAINIWPPVQF